MSVHTRWERSLVTPDYSVSALLHVTDYPLAVSTPLDLSSFIFPTRSKSFPFFTRLQQLMLRGCVDVACELNGGIDLHE